jgi:hypothetical protein
MSKDSMRKKGHGKKGERKNSRLRRLNLTMNVT